MNAPDRKHLRPVPSGGTVEPNTIAQAALRLLENNVSVLPVDPIHKNPKGMSTWTPLQETHMPPADVLRYFRPGTSVAAICGAISENLFCLDFDFKCIFLQKFRDLVDTRQPGLLDRLLTQRSQSGGQHRVYRVLLPEGYPMPRSEKLAYMALEVGGEPGVEYIYHGDSNEAPTKKADIINAGGTVNKKALVSFIGADGKCYILPGAIESKGEGGYFLVAPSEGYQILGGSFDDIPYLTLEEHDLLINCARELDEGAALLAAADTDAKKWRRAAREGEILPGDRFNSLASMPIILTEMGWAEQSSLRRNHRLGLHQYWTRPGKTEDISGTYFPETGMFHVFTDNAPPLEIRKTYDAFGLYVRHEHAGHFNVAAAHLMKEGVEGKWTSDGETHVLDLTPTPEEREAVRANILAAIVAVDDPKGLGLDILATDMVRRIAKSILSGPVKVSLLGEIKKLTGVGLGDLKAELKVAEKAAVEEAERVSQNMALNAILEATGRENIIFNAGSFRVWGSKPGAWDTLSKNNAEAMVQKHLREFCPNNLSASYVRSIVDMLRNEVINEDQELFNSKDNLVNVKNGTLELDDGLCCWEFREARREDYLTVQLPLNYDPEAKAPRFTQFLRESFETDADAADKRQLACEIIGYCLLPTTKWEKFFLFFGEAGSGKSRISLMLENMLGHENYCAVTPDQWGNKFQLAHLDGRLINSVDELKEGQLLDDAALKKITSGVTQTAEHKGQTPFSFRPFCRIIMTSNHVPDTRDFSKGVFRRAILLEFNRAVPKDKLDPDLLHKFKAESAGILNIALEAYCGVVMRGGFTMPASSLKAVRDWEMSTNKANAFLADCCVLEFSAKTGFDDVYQTYRIWAKAQGYADMSSKAFSNRMKSIGHETSRAKGNATVFRGLKLTGKYAVGVQEVFPDTDPEDDL